MVKTEATNHLVWNDSSSHESYVVIDATNQHNRSFPEFSRITEMCNPHIQWYVDNIHSNRLELQVKNLFLLARKLYPVPEQVQEEETVEDILADLESYQASQLRTLEKLTENDLITEGKGVGFFGIMKVKGDRVIQYNHYNEFMDAMPPCITILKKMLEFYLEVYPLRVIHAATIKEFVADRSNLFIGMDSEFKTVTDVVLLPLVMMNDDKHIFDIHVPIEITPTGTNIGKYHLDYNIEPVIADIEPIDLRSKMTEESLKELRGVLMIILEICFDKISCPKVIEFGNKVYSLVSRGLVVSRRKIEVLIQSFDLPNIPLAVDIVQVILDPELSMDNFSERVSKMLEVVRIYERGR
jgi:hypothetical protein